MEITLPLTDLNEEKSKHKEQSMNNNIDSGEIKKHQSKEREKNKDKNLYSLEAAWLKIKTAKATNKVRYDPRFLCNRIKHFSKGSTLFHNQFQFYRPQQSKNTCIDSRAQTTLPSEIHHQSPKIDNRVLLVALTPSSLSMVLPQKSLLLTITLPKWRCLSKWETANVTYKIGFKENDHEYNLLIWCFRFDMTDKYNRKVLYNKLQDYWWDALQPWILRLWEVPFSLII